MITSEYQRERIVRVAAIQMVAELGNMKKNLDQAKFLAKQAINQGAQLVVLPEFFTSAVAFNRRLLSCIQPLDGPAMELLKDVANEGQALVAGSYMASRGGHVYNTLVVATPDGKTFLHDKDQPTMWENCYYTGGGDPGILTTELGRLGAVLCWEFIRSRTARRLFNQVDMVIGGSCWWTGTEEAITKNPQANLQNIELLHNSPGRMARILGVPVVHASHAGICNGFSPPDESRPYNSHFLGETQIVDGEGKILKYMTYEDGAGVITADITLGVVADKTEAIPDSFWIPELPEISLRLWDELNRFGESYYHDITLPYLHLS
jgi:predicted amidohydrolase